MDEYLKKIQERTITGNKIIKITATSSFANIPPGIEFNNTRKLYNERTSSNFHLIFKNDHGINVHKFVIAACSTLLLKTLYNIEDKFSSEARELGFYLFGEKRATKCHLAKNSFTNTDKIEADVSAEIIPENSFIFRRYSESCGQSLIKFCYHISQNWDLIDLETISELLDLANEFQVDKLTHELKQFLDSKTVTDKNYKCLFQLKSYMSEIPKLKRNFDQCIQDQIQIRYRVSNIESVEAINGEELLTVKYGKITIQKDCAFHQISDSNGIILKLSENRLINFIRLRLYDQYPRSYSYYIEGSIDYQNWQKIIDYSDYICRSWQKIYFKDIAIKSIRIVGTQCYDSIKWDYFELASVELFKLNEVIKTKNNIICPDEDMANIGTGAKLISGKNNWILEYKYNDKEEDSSNNYTFHESNGSILVQLSQVMYIKQMRIGSYNKPNQDFHVEVSINCETWNVVYEHYSLYSELSDHKIEIDEQLVIFIRIKGNILDEKDTFKIKYLECPGKW